MPGQFHEEVNRYATKAASALDKLGKWVKEASQEVVEGAKATGDDLKTSFSEVGKELKQHGEDAKAYVEGTVIPRASETVEKVVAHGEVTARRVGAEFQELVRDPVALKEENENELRLAKLAVNNRVDLQRNMKGFLGSEFAKIENFDVLDKEIRGIAIFPKGKDLGTLREEAIPHRIYVSVEGLRCRCYQANQEALLDPSKPRYSFVEERAANADDLFQVRVKARQVIAALDAAREAPEYQSFMKARSA